MKLRRLRTWLRQLQANSLREWKAYSLGTELLQLKPTTREGNIPPYSKKVMAVKLDQALEIKYLPPHKRPVMINIKTGIFPRPRLFGEAHVKATG